MSNYQDKYGRYHHKPCIDGEPSSNNGWIYTAYADKLGFKLDHHLLKHTYRQCTQRDETTGRIYLIRSPYKDLPPQSRDEILGMAQLNLLRLSHVIGWSFSPRPLPRLNPIKLIQQLLEVRGKHRNYFWENNLDQIYRFAFSVPLTDRHFILSKWGKFNPIYWAIAKIDSLFTGKYKNGPIWLSEPSGIRWLKYGKSLEAMQEEFPEYHPFRLTIP